MQRDSTLVERITRGVGSVPSLIIHTLFFLCAMLLGAFGVFSWDGVLLVLTTVVSLEAIYLAIFIQMSVNQNTESLREVEEGVDAIEQDVDEIQKDVDEIQEDVDEIQKDVDAIEQDVDEIQENVGEIQEDVVEIQEDDAEDNAREALQQKALQDISVRLHQLLDDINKMKK